MTPFRCGFFLLFFFGGLIPLWAEPSISIQADAQPREITIGDPVQLRITVVFSTSVQPAALKPPLQLGNFELLSFESSPLEDRPDKQFAQSHNFVVTTFSTGTQTLPGLTLAFSETGGAVIEQKTPEVDIKVKSLLEEMGDKGNLQPLKGLINFRSYFWVWVFLFGALIAAGSWLGWRWRKRQLGKRSAPAAPARPPHETAWEDLVKLEEEDLITRGLAKEFYYRLSLILRIYLQSLYGIDALDKTTAELLHEFRNLSFSHEILLCLRQFLENGDLVKFAKFTPEPEEITEDLNRVKHFINLTTPLVPSTSEKKDTRTEVMPL